MTCNINKKYTKYINFFLYTLLTCIIIAIDRVTKYLALQYHKIYLSIIPRLFHLPPLLNRGMSLGLFNISNKNMFYLLELFGILIIIYFFYQSIFKYNENKSILGETLIIAGGIGNLIDRIYYKYVIDFIFFKLPVINYIAICNIADFSITLGCIIIIFKLLVEKKI